MIVTTLLSNPAVCGPLFLVLGAIIKSVFDSILSGQSRKLQLLEDYKKEVDSLRLRVDLMEKTNTEWKDKYFDCMMAALVTAKGKGNEPAIELVVQPGAASQPCLDS